MCSILRRCWFNSMIIWGILMMYSGVSWFSKSTVWFYLRFYGHDLITFTIATFLSALTALPSFDERICKINRSLVLFPGNSHLRFQILISKDRCILEQQLISIVVASWRLRVGRFKLYSPKIKIPQFNKNYKHFKWLSVFCIALYFHCTIAHLSLKMKQTWCNQWEVLARKWLNTNVGKHVIKCVVLPWKMAW